MLQHVRQRLASSMHPHLHGTQASLRDSFSLAWAKIESEKRLDIFVKVFLGELIAAALCFQG